MPKISASTVAEHRTQQRASLLALAREILADEGYGALHFGALAERANLARSSIYEYFASRDDLVAAVCEEEVPRWICAAQEAMDRAPTSEAKIEAFVRSQLGFAARGEHWLAGLLERVALEPQAKARVAALHAQFSPLLDDALRDLGHASASGRRVVASLVQGALFAGFHRIEGGEPAAAVTDATVAFVLAGLRAHPPG